MKTVTKVFKGSHKGVLGKATVEWQDDQIDRGFLSQRYVLKRLTQPPRSRWSLTITMRESRWLK